MASGDFRDIVQGYLDRGEIYKKPKEFVAKLALCPSLIGKGQILKDIILRMTALVKRKLDQQRNKQEDPADLAQDSVKRPGYLPSSQSGVDK